MRLSVFSPRWISVLVLAGSLLPASPIQAAGLADASSAYLRSQADAAVKWLPWGEAAFARAKQEQKPVFLFIGSSTNELTRATHRQTFANAEAAAFLNDAFVCVLVDAKDLPELTALYQTYIQAAKQLKGMPMSLWLTPELKPFEGANYLPPTEEWGKEGFLTVAKRAAAAWQADAAAQRTKADEAVAAVDSAHPPAADPIDAAALKSLLEESAGLWQARYDATNAGYGDGSKYLEPELLRFLLLRPETRDQALATLKAIGAGALHDPLDGGFFRYSTDPTWRLPYLQKTAVDQARMALAYCDALEVTDDPLFTSYARSALHYLLDRLTTPTGEILNTEDATNEALSAQFYWSYADLKAVLGDATPAFATAYGATEAGNLAPDAIAGMNTTGKNTLARATPLGDAAAEKALAASAAKLLARRDQVAKPWLDEGAPAATHGYVLLALAQVGAKLSDNRFASAAKTQATFIRQHLLQPDGSLLHLAGSDTAATAQDYALVARGLLAYGTVAKDAATSQLAAALLAKANTLYFDAAAGRYLAVIANPAAGLWTKTYAPEPLAGDLPSAEAVMALTLHRAKTDDVVVQKLTATLAADVKAAPEVPRGDQLLALELLAH